MVLHRPQTLVPSSSGTTSDGRIGALDRTAWCFTARKPLFLRRRAPRPRFPPSGQFLEPAPGSRNSHLPKKRKMSALVLLPQHLADIFPFPSQSVETVPLCTLGGQSLSYLILSYLILSCLALPCLALPSEFPKNKNGAEDEIRTRDPRLGKAMLYP